MFCFLSDLSLAQVLKKKYTAAKLMIRISTIIATIKIASAVAEPGITSRIKDIGESEKVAKNLSGESCSAVLFPLR